LFGAVSVFAGHLAPPEAAVANPISSWLLRRQTYRTPDEVLFGLAYTTSDCTDGGWGVVLTVCFWYDFYNCSE